MTLDAAAPARLPARPLAVVLHRPLRVGLAALTTVALTTTGLAVLVVTVLGGRVDRANDLLSALQDSHTAMINQQTGLRGYLVTREDRFLAPYRKGVHDLAALDDVTSGLAADDEALVEALAGLQDAEDSWTHTWATPMLVSPPAIGDLTGLSDLLSRDKALFDAYRRVQAGVRAEVEAQRSRAIAQQRLVLLGGSALSLLVAGAVAVAVSRASRRLADELLPPTRQVRDTLAALTAGDMGSRAVESGPDELRNIAAEVNALGRALVERGELVAAREAELVLARDEAQRAGQAKTAFLATMSHEIRTPLNAVLGLTDLLLTSELDADQRSHLQTIAGSGDSLLTLINDILDFSKIEAGELDLELAPFDLHDLVYDVGQLFAVQAAGKGLDLLVDVSGDCPGSVVGDGPRLRQVLLNLVANAVKFTSSGQVLVRVAGEVTGSVTAAERLTCRLSVTDTGIGIAEDQRHRLFRSFSQVDASTTRSYGGTGLGLAISQRIARAMGGDITVTSAVGEGSTFTVTVELGLSRTGGAEPTGQDLAGRRVLVVDDNWTNLGILEHQLTRAGATCVLTGGAQEALEAVSAGSFDVAVLDLHMPDADGVTLAARLRGLPAAADLPLVLLSSSATLHADAIALFAARLHKPVRPERLVATLRAVAQRTAAPAADAAPSGAEVAGAPLRVLVAEDHAVNAQLMDLYLRQLGHQADHVGNGELAVEAVLARRYDVVLMDAQMPVLGGVDATTVIRTLPVPQPVVIAVTASVLASDRTAFMAAGADAFLTKPVRLRALAGALAAHTAERREWAPAAAGTPATAVDAPQAGPLDEETVAELRDLGEDGFAHLYGQYLTSLETTVTDLLAAADPGAVAASPDRSLDRLAHRLKGSSAAMGALRLAEVCARLEELGGDPDASVADALTDALTDLQAESTRVRAAVTGLLDAGARA